MQQIESVQVAGQLRLDVLEMVANGGASHVASNLSIADIIAVLYCGILNDPGHLTRDGDRFILSKGHACAVLYAVLARVGVLEPDLLRTFYANGSPLLGHASHKGIPGIALSTGSLGHGLGVTVGMALARHRQRRGGHMYVLLSDGECDEGSVWESAMLAGHLRLGNLTAIVDYNHLQSLDTTEATLDLEPFADKWRAFGWSVSEVDGHDHLELAAAVRSAGGVPHVVLARTVKGRGVTFMENEVVWHYRVPAGPELERARRELESGR